MKQAEADQIVKSMKDKNLPVTYVLYPDEGHGFARPDEPHVVLRVAEGFLAQCLGGRYEPVGNDFKGASIKVLEGAQYVPGSRRSPEVAGDMGMCAGMSAPISRRTTSFLRRCSTGCRARDRAAARGASS